MACLRQYQFCNPALPEEGRCGLLTGFAEAQYQAAPLFNITRDQMFNMTIEQMAKNDIPQTPAAARYIWLVILLTLTVPSPATLINILGPNSLASQQSLTRSSSMLGSIPSNQWQLDVENWWAIYMASLQAGMVNTAYGSHDPALKPYEILPFNSYAQKLCNNQKILSTNYTSFSVFGISLIYVVGALIVAISYLLEHIQAWLYRHRNLKEYAYLEWTANETLQLQRMAYQGLESGHWSRYTKRIPLTKPGENLADLSRSYPLDKKNQADVEQGNSVEKLTGATVTVVQTAPPTQVETDSSTMTPCDDNSCVDQVGSGDSEPEEVVSPGHSPRDANVQPPTLPHINANPPPPAGAVAPMKVEQPTPQGSKDPVTTTPVE